MGEFLIDIAQEEADMWHQKYLDLLKKIKELAKGVTDDSDDVYVNMNCMKILSDEIAWQENYDKEQEIVREADA